MVINCLYGHVNFNNIPGFVLLTTVWIRELEEHQPIQSLGVCVQGDLGNSETASVDLSLHGQNHYMF